MGSDSLQELWKNEIDLPEISDKEMERVFELSLRSVSARLHQKLLLDISLAIGVALAFILIAYVVNLRYLAISAVGIGLFTILMIFLYILHQRTLTNVISKNRSIELLLSETVRLLNKWIWMYRICIPLFAIILYGFFSIRFALTSLHHLFWIIPFTSAAAELIIRTIYGRTLRELQALLDQFNGE